MHILFMLVVVALLIAALFWALSVAANSGRNLIRSGSELRHALNHSRAADANRDRLDSIEDARVAAAAMMVATAQGDGAMTAAERDVILRELETTIGCSPETAQSMLANARWLVRDTDDLGAVIAKLLPVIRRACGPRERTDLVRMLSAVARADGAPDDLALHHIDKLTRELTH